MVWLEPRIGVGLNECKPFDGQNRYSAMMAIGKVLNCQV